MKSKHPCAHSLKKKSKEDETMEHELTAAQGAAYDYRRCAQVWQRVDPSLTPYPDAHAAMSAQTHGDAMGAEKRAELSLPGAQADPCCMGSAALESVEVLEGFVRAELADRHSTLFLARCAPTEEARRLLRGIAADEGRHARRLSAALYLITGERCCPTLSFPTPHYAGWCAALRERYHAEACGGFNYRRASEESLDLCLQELLLEFSQDEYRHARQLLGLLAGML